MGNGTWSLDSNPPLLSPRPQPWECGSINKGGGGSGDGLVALETRQARLGRYGATMHLAPRGRLPHPPSPHL